MGQTVFVGDPEGAAEGDGANDDESVAKESAGKEEDVAVSVGAIKDEVRVTKGGMTKEVTSKGVNLLRLGLVGPLSLTSFSVSLSNILFADCPTAAALFSIITTAVAMEATMTRATKTHIQTLRFALVLFK